MGDLETPGLEEIAVIGMAGRFPGANSIDELWNNIVNGVCSIKRFTDDDYEKLGYESREYKRPNFVPALGYIENADCFDESFFSYSPKETESIDPQQRIFLEVAWQTLNDAGINSFTYDGLIGVFAGAGYNYANANDLLASGNSIPDKVDMMNFIGNEKDFLSTRVAYKLNLRGPSYTVLSACSTSLLAVHQGVQNLLTYQCDIALCGGVSLQQPKIPGYYYNEGEIFSPSGVVRTFDESASGTVLGEGCGAVALKRLSEALKDKDNIYAVIKSSAANNDGSNKAGYTAPSIQGQRDVIRYALDLADVQPQSISYIETHGTGTTLGDLIEFSALKEVFGEQHLQEKCALGAIKSNIGHLDVAAGVTGLIKTCLALKNKTIPKQINVENINNKFGIEKSPFYIPLNTETWVPAVTVKRLAGVSSFGIGGTNVHVVLEEAPELNNSHVKDKNRSCFIPVTSHLPEMLQERVNSIAEYIREYNVSPGNALSSVLNFEKQGSYRSGLVCTESGVQPLHPDSLKKSKSRIIKNVVLLFPGQGSQYYHMGEALYNENDVFRTSFDKLAVIVLEKAGFDIRRVIFKQCEIAGRTLDSTSITQICLFSIEYALYKVLSSAGIRPTHLLGHSIGEITAAAVSGVFTLDDAVDIVLIRGRCMEHGPSGAMVAVFTNQVKVEKYCSNSVYLAVNNGAEQCVLSCTQDNLAILTGSLKNDGVKYVILKNTVPFHTPLLESHLEELRNKLADIYYGPLTIPVLSNLTGSWADDSMGTADYWIKQVTSPVQFAQNMEKLAALPDCVLIEAGPGRVLSGLYAATTQLGNNHTIVSLLPKMSEVEDLSGFLSGLGVLWSFGINIDWHNFINTTSYNQIHLPPYPFRKTRYKVNLHSSGSDVPFTASSALEAPAVIASAKTTVLDLDRKNISEIIIKAWKEVLGYDKIRKDDDFFSLGGDSMSASRVSALLSKKLSVPVQPIDVIVNPTIAELEKKLLEKNPVQEEVISKRVNSEDVPLPAAPKRLWFIHEFEPDYPGFNLAQTIRITRNINVELFRETIRRIVDRHDVFKLIVINKSGVPYFRYIDILQDSFEYRDISTTFSPDVDFADIVRQECAEPVPLDKGPCYKMALYKLGSGDYRFVLYIPHILTDGWSFDIIQKEIELIYLALEKGLEPDIKKGATSYLEYVDLENTNKVQIDEASVSFWKGFLGQEEHVLKLPFDNKRPKSMKFSGSMEYFSFSKNLSEKMKKLNTSMSVSLFHLLVGIYGFVLQRFTNQDEIIIGVPDANRTSPESRDIVGFFLNMIPLRIGFDDSVTFTELCRQIRLSHANCLRHCDVGFERIIDLLDIPRYQNINPLFQTMFAFQNYMDTDTRSSDFLQEISERGISEYDLSMYMWERNGQFHGAIEFSNELFSNKTILRLLNAFLQAADMLIEDPGHILSNASVLGPEEEAELLYSVNNTESEYEEKHLFLDYFHNTVIKYAAKTAVSFEGKTLSYKELDTISSKTASYLISIGVNQGSLVGIYLDRGINMIVAILAVMKTGAAYVPLDPHFPDDRIALILNDSGLKKVISTSDISKEIAGKENDIINLDQVHKEIKTSRLVRPKSPIDPEDRVYVLYTSGSTGVPNGVQIPHRALTNFLLSMSKEPGIEPNDTMLALTTLSFDISGLELLLPLITGSSVEIVSYETAIDAAKLIGAIEKYSISIAQATPATWQMLVDAGWSGKKGLKILCGGEALSNELSSKLLSMSMNLWNLYGPTETTIWSSVFRVTDQNNEPLIGHPIENTTFYILDKNRKIVPIGVPGELYIGGKGVSLGYLNRDELNAQRFIHDPFSDKPGSFLYKTGDRVIYAGEGNFRYLERIDTQVKVRGFRIELGEIESITNKYPSVIESVCIIKDFSANDKRLMLYIREKNQIQIDDLSNYLKENLPGYMVPSHIRILENFPLTPNGKINRRILQEIIPCECGTDSIMPPRTSSEWTAVNIWKRILGIEKLGINDNFFSLGGHSLLATQIVFEMNKVFNKNWQLRDLFNNPTISELLAQDSNLSSDSIPLVFAVNKIREGVPFFLVAGVYDEMYYQKDNTSAYEEDFLRYFNNIIVHLEMETPLFGIRPRGIYRGETFNKNVESMAAENIQEIKKLYPNGPYVLGGECLGGVVAYEMAQQLIMSGETVDLLILSDTYKTTFNFMFQYKLVAYRRIFADAVRKTIKKLAHPDELKNFSNISTYFSLLFPITRKRRESRRLFLGSYLYANKLIKYRPKKLECYTLLLINELWNNKHSNLKWSSKELPNLDIRVIKGDHNTKLTDHGNITGKIIRDYLQ